MILLRTLMHFFQFGNRKSLSWSEINWTKKGTLLLMCKEGREYHISMTQTHF